MKITHLVTKILICVIAITVLALTLRGIKGTPIESNINDPIWKDEGPLELSPDRGRFALMYSFVENKSLQFSLPIARFAAPDVAYSNGQYVSLFAPAVSFIVAPGYLIGKLFGLGQVGAFAINALFAFINMLLIWAISRKIGASRTAAIVASFAFLFATPAFAYAVTLYQHHLTTFLLLLSIYVLLKTDRLWSSAVVFFCAALSIPVDNPNAVFMLPVSLWALSRLVSVLKTKTQLKITVKSLGILTAVGGIIPLVLFLSFNQISHGDPFKLSGTLPAAKVIDTKGEPVRTPVVTEETTLTPETKKKTATGFFKSRNLVNGFYIHSISPDRGTIVFAPLMLIGFFGLIYRKKAHRTVTMVLLASIGFIVLLYSMWGDPWGGWAFGSRYLIPAYALAAILLSLALDRFSKKIIPFLFVLVVLIYSISVNTLGAITSNRNPPEVEAIALQEITNRIEPVSFDRNLEFLQDNRSKSYVYQEYFSDTLLATEYYVIVLMLTLSVPVIGFFYMFFTRKIPTI